MIGRTRRPIIAFLIVLVGLYVLLRIASLPLPLGDGSMRYARRWKDKLAGCNSLDEVRKKFNCGRYRAHPLGSYLYVPDPNTNRKGNAWALLYDLPTGDWLAMAYASSHHGGLGGGTVVTRDSTGRIRAFFGHVCGRPFAHGASLEEIYASFEENRLGNWKEVNLDK
jgi:hypothetical protein